MSWPIDVGAEIVHGKDVLLYKIAKQNGWEMKRVRAIYNHVLVYLTQADFWFVTAFGRHPVHWPRMVVPRSRTKVLAVPDHWTWRAQGIWAHSTRLWWRRQGQRWVIDEGAHTWLWRSVVRLLKIEIVHGWQRSFMASSATCGRTLW